MFRVHHRGTMLVVSLSHSLKPHRVVVVGGGIAALETVLALHDQAARHVQVTLIAPEPAFTVRPLNVERPFSRRRAGHLDLERFMSEHHGRFRRTAASSVDADLRTVQCTTGPDEPYDALVIAVGASTRPAFEHALTIGADLLALNGLLGDLDQGYARSVAFVIPRVCAWPLPLYELALTVADEVWSTHEDGVALHLVTPEAAPLALFGPDASAAIRELMRAARITLHPGIDAAIPGGDHVDLGDGHRLDVDRVVALPSLTGPRLEGLPSDPHGFLPVAASGRVHGVEAVYAAGDVTDHPIKHGAAASEQADAVAGAIAATVGGSVGTLVSVPVPHGRLLTDHEGRFQRRSEADGIAQPASRLLWWPPMILCSRYLGPYLEARGLVELAPDDTVAGSGVDVSVSVQPAG